MTVVLVNYKNNNKMLKSDIGLIGLAVMGENLALNMESKGYKVSVYNRTVKGVEEGVVERFLQGRAAHKNIDGFVSLLEFVESLQSPRKIMMMVRAGAPVDELIDQLVPILSKGDILIDGGNSNFEDTARRVEYVESKGLYFIGAGVSGGEEGALNGPAIMPGGSKAAWPAVKDILQKIAAKAEDGTPCCTWIGNGGSGHFVKMIHNGIEYGDMQLIAETYFVMKQLLNAGNEWMSDRFEDWNNGKLKSYLIEITTQILRHKEANGDFLIDKILDTAGQKGTGKWSVINALNLGTPLNLIATAVFERNLSAMKGLRKEAAALYKNDTPVLAFDPNDLIGYIGDALYASKLVSYAQGFETLQKASEYYKWDLSLPDIARIWRGGCIIRSAFLNDIAKAFESEKKLENMLLSPYFAHEIKEALKGWKTITAMCANEEVAVPAFSSALNYFYSFTSKNLPANMIQAQRDYFGAHTFERIDKPRGEFFHENWTGHGGDTHSGKYNN